MPTQQRLGLDKEASSAGSQEKPAQSGENRSIRGPQGRTRHLSAQDANFVAEHYDLDLPDGSLPVLPVHPTPPSRGVATTS
jgi:hypothetical protein